jgi:hypothetical protein
VAPDDVTPTESGGAAVEQPARPASPRRERGHAKAFEGRFSVAYLALAVVVAGAIIGFALILKEGSKSTARWSSWKPTADGIDASRQIATHVEREYRLANGAQMTTNLVAPFSYGQVPITGIAVRNGTGPRDVNFFDGTFSSNAPYTFCGLGKNCSIISGRASRARGRLVRRQAIETALYTFKYVKGVKTVLAYLPPTAGNPLNHVLFLRKADFKPQLSVPLEKTLPGKGPFKIGGPAPEEPGLDDFAIEHIFSFTFQQIPDGSAIIVLTPRELSA